MIWAVRNNHNSVLALLLKTASIDVNMKINKRGWCALREAVHSKNNEALKMLLEDVPDIDKDCLEGDYDDMGGAVHWIVRENNIEGLKLLMFKVPNVDVNVRTNCSNESGNRCWNCYSTSQT